MLSPGVLGQPTSSPESTTPETSDVKGRKLDVERETLVRLMHFCHENYADAVRSGNHYGQNFWDGAIWFGRHCFEGEDE